MRRCSVGERSGNRIFEWAVATALMTVWGEAVAQETPRHSGVEGNVPGEIEWSRDLPGTLARAREVRKPVVVDFGARWCSGCRRFREETLFSPLVRQLGDRFLWVMVDIDREVSLARSYGVKATPRFDFVDPDGVTRFRLTGFVGPLEFRKHLEVFLRALEERPRTPGPQLIEIEGETRTPLTWFPDGYRGWAICFSNVGYGPLHLPSLSPFQSLRFGFVPSTPSTLGRGNFEVRLHESWANIWARNEGDHLLDFEILRSEATLAFGITDSFQLELGLVEKARFGGAMDGFIQGFHDLFHIDQGGRDEVPRGDFAAELAADQGRPAVSLGNGDRGLFAQSLVLTLQHNLTCGTEDFPALSYAVTSRFPLDSEDLESDGPLDLGVCVATSKRFGDFYAYAGVGLAWFGGERFHGIRLRSTQLTGLAVLEWRFSARMSIVGQYLVNEGVAENLGPFSRPSHEVTLGWKGEIGQGVVLEIGLIENIFLFDNSPDFGLHGGLTVRF